MEIIIKTEPDPDVKPCNVFPENFATQSISPEEHTLKSSQHKMLKKLECFNCSECFTTKQRTRTFPTQSLLNKHKKKVHVPARFKCDLCFKAAFKNSSDLRVHKMIHSKQDVDKSHKCDLCPKAFLVKKKLDNHLMDVHQQNSKGVKYFECEFCSQKFRIRCKLESHVVEKHVVDKEFECRICSKTFIDLQTLEKHRKRHDREIAHFCDICSRGFRSARGLVYHLKAEHSQPFHCTKCLRSFKNKSEFDQHLNPKTTLDFKCGICYKILNSPCLRDTHTNYHLKEIKVENESTISLDQKKVQVDALPGPTQELPQLLRCDLCLKNFDRKDHLRAHRKIVHPKANWPCKQCSKTFIGYSRLEKHRKIHLREPKSFVCSVCPDAFSRSSDLAKHEESHDLKETEHKCKMCSKYLKTANYLRRHKAKVHDGGGLTLLCPVKDCATWWPSSSGLKKHLVSHQTERLFKCEMCPQDKKAFKTMNQLRDHQRLFHKKNMTRVRGWFEPSVLTKRF